jgi:hypothetical protein
VTIVSTLQSVTVDGTGEYVAVIAVTNQGNITANSLALSSAKLGTPGALSLPTIPSLGPGVSDTLTLTFPASAGKAGKAVALKIAGTYSAALPGGGTTSGTWSATFRVTLP